MTQTPITVTYSIEEILGQINQNLASLNQKVGNLEQKVSNLEQKVSNLEQKVDNIDKKVSNLEKKVDNLQESITELKIDQVRIENELKGEIKTLDAKVEGIGKRLDTQEFINRSVVVGFVLAVGAAVTKILFPNWLA